eukprot:2702389-Pyramimonas_sp.AAC.1
MEPLQLGLVAHIEQLRFARRLDRVGEMLGFQAGPGQNVAVLQVIARPPASWEVPSEKRRRPA